MSKQAKDILISQASSKDDGSVKDLDEDKDEGNSLGGSRDYEKQQTYRSNKLTIKASLKSGSRSASMYQLGLAGQLTDRSGGRSSVIGSVYGKRVVDKFEDIQNTDEPFQTKVMTLIIVLLVIFVVPVIQTLKNEIRDLELPMFLSIQ